MLQAANINPDTYIKQDEEVDNEPLVENEPEDDGRMVEYPPEAFDVDGIIGAGNDIVVEVVEVAPEALERIAVVGGGIEKIVAGDIENNNGDIENIVFLHEKDLKDTSEGTKVGKAVVEVDGNKNDNENNGGEHRYSKKRKCGYLGRAVTSRRTMFRKRCAGTSYCKYNIFISDSTAYLCIA